MLEGTVPLLQVVAPVVVPDGPAEFSLVKVVERSDQSPRCGEGPADDEERERGLDWHLGGYIILEESFSDKDRVVHKIGGSVSGLPGRVVGY